MKLKLSQEVSPENPQNTLAGKRIFESLVGIYVIYGGRDQSTPHASVRRRQDVPVSGTGNKLRVAFGMAGSNEPTTAAWSRNSDRCIVLAAVFCI